MPLLLSFGSRSIRISGYATIPRAKRHQISAEFWSQVMSDRDLSPGQDRVSVASYDLLSSAQLQKGDLTGDHEPGYCDCIEYSHCVYLYLKFMTLWGHQD